MDNMQIYNKLRQPPPQALKPIQAGRLKGKTDVNPMWRIQALTETFGACGQGWKYEIVNQWTEEGANGEKAAFCNINLYVKLGDKWSEPIPGVGGSMLIAKEKNGLYTSDECYKMALTDAISVACKALGMAGNVYWQQDPTKYISPQAAPKAIQCSKCGQPITAVKNKTGQTLTPDQLVKQTGGLCMQCYMDSRIVPETQNGA